LGFPELPLSGFNLSNSGNNSGATGGGTSSSGGISNTGRCQRHTAVTNAQINGVPIWYVVPVPMTGESRWQSEGNEAIPSGGICDFKDPAGDRTINLICPDTGEYLRVYQKSGVTTIDNEVTELILSGVEIAAICIQQIAIDDGTDRCARHMQI
jgi:hypothetical protein